MFTQENKNELSTNYQFIVVYDKFTKPVANSIKNRAVAKSITSTIWSERDYLDTEAKLTNKNHVLFLSKKLIKDVLSDPSVESIGLNDGVRYKKQGHAVGIYLEDIDYTEAAKRLARNLKENWKGEVAALIGGGIVGIGLFTTYSYWTESKKAKLYLLYKAVGEYTQKYLENFVAE